MELGLQFVHEILILPVEQELALFLGLPAAREHLLENKLTEPPGPLAILWVLVGREGRTEELPGPVVLSLVKRRLLCSFVFEIVLGCAKERPVSVEPLNNLGVLKESHLS